MKHWWQGTHILPSQLSMLMIPRTQKNPIICVPSLTMQGQVNSPAQPGRGADDRSMSTQDKAIILRLPTFPLTLKL